MYKKVMEIVRVLGYKFKSSSQTKLDNVTYGIALNRHASKVTRGDGNKNSESAYYGRMDAI